MGLANRSPAAWIPTKRVQQHRRSINLTHRCLPDCFGHLFCRSGRQGTAIRVGSEALSFLYSKMSRHEQHGCLMMARKFASVVDVADGQRPLQQLMTARSCTRTRCFVIVETNTAVGSFILLKLGRKWTALRARAGSHAVGHGTWTECERWSCWSSRSSCCCSNTNLGGCKSRTGSRQSRGTTVRSRIGQDMHK
jgi:hypothetical protein